MKNVIKIYIKNEEEETIDKISIKNTKLTIGDIKSQLKINDNLLYQGKLLNDEIKLSDLDLNSKSILYVSRFISIDKFRERWWNFILKYSHKKLDWLSLSSNPNLTMDIIEKYIDMSWYWSGVLRNQNITIAFIEKYPDKDWDWGYISSNPNLTMEMIEKYPNKQWNWKLISRNPNLTMEMIEKYPDKPWDWKWISTNQNISMTMIDKYPNKPWNWEYISTHSFEYERKKLCGI